MPLGSPKPALREQAIEATRRRLRRLEIDVHRVKADLARLEAEYEDDVADRLTRKLRRRTSPAIDERVDSLNDAASSSAAETAISSAVLPFAPIVPKEQVPRRERIAVAGVSDPGYKVDPGDKLVAGQPAPTKFVADANGATPPTRRTATYRTAASPLAFSFAVHAVALLLCMTFTFATLVQQGIPLFASQADSLDEAPEELSEVEITAHKFDDSELQNTILESDEFNIADSALRELEAPTLGTGSQALGDVGQLDALPSELGTLMAGAGSPGSGKPGGRLGEAVFFGARSKGDRFVFVVDNSSSMKDGRFDAAIRELVKSVDGLSPRQSFYVIFVSDQPYPMFYPQQAPELLPATKPNKERLGKWLPNAILASGKNRELIKAMNMAAALRPHAVFLLWDSDWRYGEPVRREVMVQLARPNDWNFVVHTIGMGTTSLDAEFHLSAVAKAHGGTFQRVDVPGARSR